MKTFFALILGIVLGLYIEDGLNAKKTLEEVPEPSITIVYQDDCYVGEDYTSEILSAKEVEQYLIREIK